jgi:hypothetical protein
MSNSGLLTTDGHALIAAKIAADAKLNITTFKFANVNGLDPNTLPENYSQSEPTADLVHTMAVTRAGSINSDTVVYSAVLDTTIGDFNFNWIGLYDENDTLVFIKYTAMQYKTGDTFGGGNNLTRNFALKFTGAAEVTNITIPAESWQFDVSEKIFERLDWQPIYADAMAIEGFRYRLMNPVTLTIPEAQNKSIHIVGDVDSGISLASPASVVVQNNGPIRTTRGEYSEFLLTKNESTWRIDYVDGVATL